MASNTHNCAAMASNGRGWPRLAERMHITQLPQPSAAGSDGQDFRSKACAITSS